MNRLVKSALFVFGFLLLFSRADGQNLPEYHFKILQDSTLTFYLFSHTFPNEVAPFPAHGDLSYPVLPLPPSDDYTTVKYVPEAGFTGTDHFVFQYRGDPGTGYFSWEVKFSEFWVEVLPSILETAPDHRIMDLNDGTLEIDVLANDSSTHGPISVTELTNMEGGTAFINGDNTINFTPNAGFEGTAYFNYLAEDDAGSIELGQVSILVLDTENQTEELSFDLATLNTKPLTILVPDNDFEVDELLAPVHGTLENQEANIFVYTPEVDFGGTDTFLLSNGLQNRFYYLEIYDLPNDGLGVVDDEVFTLENEPVIFNVNDNDYIINYMDEWTQPNHGFITYLDDGEFSYTPDEDYHGYDEFTYTKRVAPMVWQTATVRIGVSKFLPVSYEEYRLNTLKDQAVVVDYNIPVSDYSFIVVSDPDNGSLTFYEGFQTITIGCNVVSGYNLLIYEPDVGFSGTDEFEVDYCPAEADCQLVKVSVEVIDEVLDPDCPCVGSACVWKGDTNRDGVVNVKDLLPVGYYMGAEGSERAYDSDDWVGLNADDWTNNAGEINPSLKHVDADGNGLVNALDTSIISQNYENLHSILPKGVNAQKPYPFYITTEQDSVKKGDRLFLDISIGNAEYPVLDLTGITYTMQFPAFLVDSSSVNHEFLTNAWFGNASSTLQMDKQPLEGKIDAGLTRIGGIGVSGHGPVAKCDFIVEDDIEGLKLKSDIVPIKISISGATGMDQFGNTIQLPGAEKVVYLDLRDKKEAPEVNDLYVYPNPTSDYINIHLNGQNEFGTMHIYTSTGLRMESFAFDGLTNNTRLNIQDYNPGVYILVVETPNGKTAQRFEVIK